MNAVDALLTDCTAKSFVELPLSPEWHGAKFDCKNVSTQTTLSATYTGQEADGQEFEVCAFSRLHFQKARSVSVTLLRVMRQGATGAESAGRNNPGVRR